MKKSNKKSAKNRILSVVKKEVIQEPSIRIDIGCGKAKKEGYIGVDIIKFDGVDVVMNAGKDKWPWKDNSVELVHCSHFVEHLEAMERVHFVNELYRVLKVGSQATIIVPHWASCRAYGDLTHKWPPVSEMWFYYLSKEWREVNAPHNCVGMYECDFNIGWGNVMSQDIIAKNQDFQTFAQQNYKEAITDLIATFTKK